MRRIINLIRHFRNWPSYWMWKFFTSKNSSLTFQTRSGMSIDVPPALMHTFKECFFDGVYLRHVEITHQSPVVIDIGANAGYFSFYIFHLFPQAEVFAYEPVPENFNLLRHYKEQFPHFEFRIFNEAAGKTPGKLKMHFEREGSFTTSASFYKGEMHRSSRKVQVKTLEEIITGNTPGKIDLLKMDCEGAEYDILYPCPKHILSKIRSISMETHPLSGKHQNRDAMIRFLEKEGFHTVHLRSKIWASR